MCLMLASLLCSLSLAAQAQPCLLDTVGGCCAASAPVDTDSNGVDEISLLKPMGPEYAASGTGRGLVLVLVEARLAEPGAEGPDLGASLHTYVGDLAAEGWDAIAVKAKVYAGARHQDGLTLLAIREFLRRVYAAVPQLKALVMVGDFPEASLVRQYAWWRHEQLTLNKGKDNETVYDAEGGIDDLRCMPEPVAYRCELILGDLDGRWEVLYHMGPEYLAYAIAAYPQGRDRASEGADAIEEGTVRFEDFFLVNDGRYDITYEDGTTLLTAVGPSDDECTADDKSHVNPVARPEIGVSRLDARHASVVPDPKLVDKDGKHLLDENERPQTLEFESEDKVPHPLSFWVPSEATERKMLAEWFERRHRFRLGMYASEHKPASIGTGWGSAVEDCKQAFAEWADFSEEGYDVEREDVNLTEVVEWLKRPAVARGMKAHGDPWGCVWTAAPDPAALDAVAGPIIMNWRRDGTRLVPTLGGTSAKLDYAVTRSLYESKTLPENPAVWMYTACEGIAPAGWDRLPYNDPKYGFWQGGEGIVFHLQGLAVVGRAKVFYDEPREFWAVLGKGGTVGEGWRHYFDVEAEDRSMFEDGIGSKRSYFWSVLGDCTVSIAKP